ncbi:FHA domain-containing protein [bacterium]|nr:FHA domain-containing protein [bacterium]
MLWLLVGSVVLALCSCGGRKPREVWISNILANPPEFWHVEVKLIGIVQDIEVNPKGTRQGFYQLMDLNKQVIMVKTVDLPDVGDKVVVVGVVGQLPDNAIHVLIVETDRQWVWTSFINIAVALVLFLTTVGLVGYRLFRYPGRPEQVGAGRIKAQKPPFMAQRGAGLSPSKAGSGEQQKAETMLLNVDQVSLGHELKKNATIELEVLAGPDKGKRFHFTRSVITIGRSGRRLNDIELKDITISREQASIELNRAGTAYILRNEGKTNPTLVNGKALAIANLKQGDEILVGTTLLRYSLIE